MILDASLKRWRGNLSTSEIANPHDVSSSSAAVVARTRATVCNVSTEPVLVCLYEDRPQQVTGLKVLLLSLDRHCPTWPVRLRFPGISDGFRKWLERLPRLSLCEEKLAVSRSYNVKPSVLLEGLSAGGTSCLWLDTDILVNGSLDFLAGISPDTVVVSQDPWEYPDGSVHRCCTWQLQPARSLPGPLNSAVVRVSRQHEGLLEKWQDLVLAERYLREQTKPATLRNPHMLGDQDVLSALMASREFASVPVRRLLHSKEILQHHGAGAYGPIQRWSNLLHGMPPLIHAMGTVKPWNMPENPGVVSSPRDYYERAYLELSPYVHIARQFRHDLDEELGWLDVRTGYGVAGTLIAFDHPALKGLTQATLHRTQAFR